MIVVVKTVLASIRDAPFPRENCIYCFTFGTFCEVSRNEADPWKNRVSEVKEINKFLHLTIPFWEFLRPRISKSGAEDI